MINNTNASATQAGFHYQDMVGLILLFDNIRDIEAINVEGDDDVDILFSNGTKAYYQVKEVSNPFSQKMSEKLKDALATLNEDSKIKDVKSLVYVSNAHQMLGSLKNSNIFNDNYASYDYEQLPDQLKKKIDKQLVKYPDIDIKMFKILKIHYAGNDTRTREIELDKRIDEFIGLINVPKTHQLDLKNEWKQMVSRTTEFPKKKITKHDFYAHTVVVEMFHAPDFEDFFSKFNIDFGNEEYIKNTYQIQVSRLFEKFELINSIHTEFFKFQKAHRQYGREEMLKGFINSYCEILKLKLGLVQEKDDDVVKLMIWIAVRTNTLTNQIKEVINL